MEVSNKLWDFSIGVFKISMSCLQLYFNTGQYHWMVTRTRGNISCAYQVHKLNAMLWSTQRYVTGKIPQSILISLRKSVRILSTGSSLHVLLWVSLFSTSDKLLIIGFSYSLVQSVIGAGSLLTVWDEDLFSPFTKKEQAQARCPVPITFWCDIICGISLVRYSNCCCLSQASCSSSTRIPQQTGLAM